MSTGAHQNPTYQVVENQLKATQGNGASLSENDLIQHVAQKYTKNQMQELSHGQTLRSELAKQTFVQNLQSVTKVWQAFSKFIKNQCEGKSKPIDTLLIGTFVPDGQKCILVPSLEYIEAGKFKLPKSIMNEINSEPRANYQAYYDSKVSNPTPLNFGSIAMVCNIKADKAKQILTDIFACLVELRRKHLNSKEFKLKLKSFGNIIVSRNGEMSFNLLADASEQYSNIDKEECYADYGARPGEDELSTVIDGASAILSQGGGMTFSVKSRFMASLSSVKTPRSQISSRSSVPSSIFKKQQMWGKYRTKSKKIGQADDIFQSQMTPRTPYAQSVGRQSQATSIRTKPDPFFSGKKQVPESCEQPNLLLTRNDGKQFSSTVSQQQKKKTIPFPFLEQMIQNAKTQNTIAKRMQFTKEPEDELLKHISKQMVERQQRDMNDEVDRIMNEKKDLKDFRQRIILDTKQLANDKQLQKLEFMAANNELVSRKIMQQMKFEDEKHFEKINYFPFTHGDAIESQQKKINAAQKEQLVDLYLIKEQKAEEEKRQKLEIVQLNKAKKEERIRRLAMQETWKEEDDKHRMTNAFSDGYAKEDLFENSKMLVTPYNDVMDIQNMKVRIQKDYTKQAKVMEQAIMRHEKDLEKVANEKQIQMRDFENNQNQEQLNDNEEKERNLKIHHEMKYGLQKQLQENLENKVDRLAALKLPMRNSMGPEYSNDQIKFKQQVKKLRQSKLREELNDQITQKQLLQKEEEQAERQYELKDAEKLLRMEMEEDELIKQSIKLAKEKNASAWLEQSNMNKFQNQIEAMFV